MIKRYRNLFKWGLYSAALLAVMLISSVVLGDKTFFGVRLSLLPVYVCCVACREDHENGGLFALIAAVLWHLSGMTGATVFVLVLPAVCLTAGYVCTAWLTRGLLPTMAGCLAALVLCEGGILVQRLFMDMPMPSDALTLLGIQILLSMAAAPVFWLAVRCIAKAGG